MAETVRVAVIQDCPVPFDLQGTVAKAEALTEKAAATGARLIVFPEAFVSGYPKGLDFGARVGSRSPQGRDMFRRYYDSSLELDSEECRRLAAAARKAKAHVALGVMEKDGGTLYCTVLFFGPDGALLGKHRKLMPTAMERLIWGFGDGSTITVLDTPFGKLGAVICWENYMPLLRTAMYAKGVQIYCAPTADDRDTWLPTMQTVALEGRCFVLSACQYLTRGDCPADYDAIQGADPKTVLMRGGSLHHLPARASAGRASLQWRDHPHRRPRSRRHCARQIRFRRHRPLRAAGRVSAACQRARDDAGLELDRRTGRSVRGLAIPACRSAARARAACRPSGRATLHIQAGAVEPGIFPGSSRPKR